MDLDNGRQRVNVETRCTLVRVAWFVASCLMCYGLAVAAEDRDQQWPQWRGPLGTGFAPHADPPVEWSESRNVRWKTPIPGLAHASPVVWGDFVFLTTAIPFGEKLAPIYDRAPGSHDNVPVTQHHEFITLCLNRADGKIVWRKSLNKVLPRAGGHHTGSLASHSPVTDGENVIACFGSHGLYCLNVDGDLKWQVDLGDMESLHGHGEGSSPALFQKNLVVNWDHEGQSFVVALDVETGKERWRVMRDEVTSWATPIIVDRDNGPQVIVSGTSRVRGYDLATGRVIWECGGLSANVVASPVANRDMVFVGSSYDIRALLAIRLDGAKGDITGTDQVAWMRSRGTPYVPSPLLMEENLYFLTHYQNIISRVDARTGQDRPGAIRLPGLHDIYASPAAGGGRVYVTDRSGATVVLEDGNIPRMLARNQLDDSFSASAALAGREIYLRGQRFLYCIAEK